MSIPKEPRQQMINIMYLVLIALLALNVSAEILNAFRLLKKGMETSNISINSKIESTMKSFEKKVADEKRGEEYLEAAGKAREYSAEFQQFVKEMDAMLVEDVGLNEKGELSKADDLDTPSRLFVEGKRKSGEDIPNGPLGEQLETKIEEFRQKFLSLFEGEAFDTSDRRALESALTLQIEQPGPDDKQKTWARKTFYMMPALAARTLLTKFENDMISTESAVVDKLFGKVGEVNIIFDEFKAAVIPSASKLIQGEKFEAQIYLAATSSMAKPVIRANGQTLSLNSEGIAVYSASTGSVGEKTLTGSITYKDGYGNPKKEDFTYKYSVVPPPDHVGVVQANKMNVFYIGVDNPVTASITGIEDRHVNVSMTGGSINKAGGAGQYKVNVNGPPGPCKVNLSASKTPTGKPFSASVEYRIKRIPDPVPKLGNKAGGKMGTGEMKAQQGVLAILENFDFDARFNVSGFEMTLAERGEDLMTCTNSGPSFSGQCKNLINRAKVGSIYYIDNIKAVGPDKTTRSLPTISFRIM